MPYAAICPNRSAQGTRRIGALHHRAELWPTDACHHPRGAHGTGSNSHLDDICTRAHEIVDPIGGHHVARDQRHTTSTHVSLPVPHFPDRLQRLEHSILMTVCRVDDQHVNSGVEQCLCSGGDIAVDSERGANHEPTFCVHRWAIQRRTQRMLPGHDAQQLPILDQEGCLEVPMGQLVEDLDWRRLWSSHQQIAGHHLMHLSESVDARGLGLADSAQRLTILDHDCKTVRPLGNQ
jgi:hypothetical protein